MPHGYSPSTFPSLQLQSSLTALLRPPADHGDTVCAKLAAPHAPLFRKLKQTKVLCVCAPIVMFASPKKAIAAAAGAAAAELSLPPSSLGGQGGISTVQYIAAAGGQ